MRNWHTKVIKLNEAKNIITANSGGNPDLYVGVIEGKIEYSQIDDTASKYENYNYESPNSHLVNGSGDRKVIYRQRVDSSFYDENLPSDVNELSTMTHTTCVAAIIAGKNSENVFGICPDIKIINADAQNVNQFEVALLLGLVNEYSKGNIGSYYYDKNILKKNSVGAAIDGTGFLSNAIPLSPKNPANNLGTKKCSIISCSYTLSGYTSDKKDEKNMPKEIADFIFQELFAYGRDGRGILTVFAAGNIESDIDGTNSGAVFSPKTMIVAASKITLDKNNMNIYNGIELNNIANVVFDEDKAKYSNYGRRVDICAPSCPYGKSEEAEVEIYAPTAINCGEIGEDYQLFDVSIASKSSNNKELTLDNKYNAILVGQSIEIGNPINFTHELRFVTKVETIQFPANPDPTLNLKTKITIDKALVFTKDSALPINARVCFYKKSVTQFSISQLTVEDFNGIGNYQSPLQKAYLYSEDPMHVNDFSIGMAVTIKTRVATVGSIIDIQEPINLSRLTNLKLIPGQITTKLKKASFGTGFFVPKDSNSSLQGFFSGQQVYINEESVKRHLKFVNGSGATAYTQFSQLNSEPEDGSFSSAEYNIKSLAYGNITSSFGGTSAATPIVSGVAALVLSTNNNLNAAELKHILKITAQRITTSSYSVENDIEDYNYSYAIHKYYGTGRIDAEKAIKLAKNWHCAENGQPLPHPEVPVQKPRLEIADKLNGTVIENVPLTDPVDSPDIWVSELANSNTTPVAPFNVINTLKKQYINVRVRNTGNRNSFKESDLRVFVAFTDEGNPAFPFPAKWYDQADVKLLAVKEIPSIAPNSQKVIQIAWEDIAAKWNAVNSWNPIDPTTGRRKKTYILAHIAPFDGLASELSLANIRNNKQLTCKELVVKHNGMIDGMASLPGNTFNITVGSVAVTKDFTLSMENALGTDIDVLKIKATKKSRTGNIEDVVFFSKNGNSWSVENGQDPGWIIFNDPIEAASGNIAYKDIKFPHRLTVNEQESEVKIEVVV